MSARAMLFVGAIPILWIGRLLPRVPPAGQSAAIAGYALVLLIWLAVLSGSDCHGAGGRLGRWRMRWLPIGATAGIVLFVLGGLGYAFSERVLGLPRPAETALLGRSFDLRFGLLLSSALGAAVLEEWVFRGWLLQSMGFLPSWAAAAITSIVFAAYHLSLFQAIPTLILGLGLATLVSQAGSVWPAVIAHGLFNGLGLVLTTVGTRIQSAG